MATEGETKNKGFIDAFKKRLLIFNKEFFREHYIILIILLFAIGLRAYWFSPVTSFDETQYLLEATHFKEGTYNPNILYHLQGIRYMMIIPVAAILSICTLTPVTAVLYIFILSIGQILLIYLFGRKIFDKNVGLLAAFLLAIFPLDVYHASILEADVVVSFLMGISLYLYYTALQNNQKIYFIFSGFIFGVAFFSKIFAVLVGIFFILYEIVCMKNFKEFLKRWTMLGIGFCFIAIPIFMYQYAETNNFMYNIYVEKNFGNYVTQFKDTPAEMIPLPEVNDFKSYTQAIFLLPTYLQRKALLNIYFILFFISVGYYSYKRTPATILLILWSIPTFILLYIVPFIIKLQRYLLTIELPIILLVAFFLLEMKQKSRTFFYTVLILIVIISFYQLGPNAIQTVDSVTWTYGDEPIRHPEESFYLFIKEYPEKNIYVTHYEQVAYLNVYFGFTRNYTGIYGYRGATNTSFYDLHSVTDLNQIHDSYVFFSGQYLDDKYDPYHYYNSSLDLFRNNTIPQNWHVLTTIETNTGPEGAIFYVE